MLVYLKETRYTTVEIDTEDFEEAQELAKAAYVRDDIDFNLDNCGTFFEISEDESHFVERWYTPAEGEEFAGKITADGTFIPR